jgi:tetratricopeptide (TPR) repeat protein
MIRIAGLLLLAANAAFAADGTRRLTPEEAFREAGAHYEASRFAEAAELYGQTAKLVPESASAHYNLGNALLRLGAPGSLGQAIASYGRAFRIAPRDADIRHNFEFALKRAGEELIPAGTPPVLWRSYRVLSLIELKALHFLFLWVALLLGTLWVVRAEWRERLTTPLAAAAALWLAAGGWWGIRVSTGLKAPAVVVLGGAEVRSGPGASYPVGFKVPEGRRVSRLGSVKNGWIEIGVPKEGLTGWIEKEALEAI